MLPACLTAAAYLTAAALLLWSFASERRRSERPALLLALVAVALHSVAHFLGYRQAGAVDLHFFAALSLVGLAVSGITALLSLQRPVAALGLVIYPIAAISVLLYGTTAGSPSGVVPTWQIQLHAGLALLAYAALSVAALLSIMLWLQERALRQRRLATALRAFPPLSLIESLLFRLIGAGFFLLTLALLSGLVFVENLFAQHLVHKTVLSLLAWVVFGALLYGRLRHGWRGRRAVKLTLAAMLLLGLAFFGSKFVLELVLARAH